MSVWQFGEARYGGATPLQDMCTKVDTRIVGHLGFIALLQNLQIRVFQKWPGSKCSFLIASKLDNMDLPKTFSIIHTGKCLKFWTFSAEKWAANRSRCRMDRRPPCSFY